MMKIGITGQNGFIGSHLFNYLGLQDDIELIPFKKNYFQNQNKLKEFVSACDTIVHLAAMNRHVDQNVIYNINIELVEKLILACNQSKSAPHILISSSIQEENDNPYGSSKKEGRERLEEWASKNNGLSTALIIPNVFGAFGKPEYNSVVATFCHKLIQDEEPKIIVDRNLKLIYVHHLILIIYQIIKDKKPGKIEIQHQYQCKVSELNKMLNVIKEQYFIKGEIPSLLSGFELDLFNTFRSYIPHSYFPKALTKHTDDRGSFIEIVRANTSGQFSISTTVPGITRGNHFHTRKAERFAVIKGKARIDLRKIDTDEIISYELDGENPSYVDIPIWYTHSITNIGVEELLTLFWINEPYNSKDADTFFVNV